MRRSLLAPLVVLLPILACVAGSAQVTPQAPTAGPPRVGVVNVQYAILMTRDGSRASDEIKARFERTQIELDELQQALERDKADIERQAQAATLAGDALAKRKEAWNQRRVEIQARFLEMNTELQKEQKKAVDPLVARMNKTVARLAEKEHYALILNAETIPFVDASLDLTEQAIAAFDAEPD